MSASLSVTVLARSGGYRAVGLGWTRTEGWRVRLWVLPARGCCGLFLPRGVTGELPERVTVLADGERLGSGALVPGMRGVLLRMEAWPRLQRGESWLDVTVPAGVAWRTVQ